MKKIICLLLCIIMLGASATSIAASVTADTVRSAVEMAQSVVCGTIVEKRFGGAVYPDGSRNVEVLIRVDEVLAGYAPQYMIVNHHKFFLNEKLATDYTIGTDQMQKGDKYVFFLLEKSKDLFLPTMAATPLPEAEGTFRIDGEKLLGAERFGITLLAQLKKQVKKNKKYLDTYFNKSQSRIWPQPLSYRSLIAASDVVAIVKLENVTVADDGYYATAKMAPSKVYKNALGLDWAQNIALPYGVESGTEYVISLAKKDGMFRPTEYYNDLAIISGKEGKAIQKELAKGFGYKPYGKVLSIEAREGRNIVDIPMDVSSLIITLANREIIYEFSYKTSEAAQNDAGCLSSSGSTYTAYDGNNIVATIDTDYVKPPHFFLKGNKIALYCGNNKQTLSLLTKLFGKQFSGR